MFKNIQHSDTLNRHKEKLFQFEKPKHRQFLFQFRVAYNNFLSMNAFSYLYSECIFFASAFFFFFFCGKEKSRLLAVLCTTESRFRASYPWASKVSSPWPLCQGLLTCACKGLNWGASKWWCKRVDLTNSGVFSFMTPIAGMYIYIFLYLEKQDEDHTKANENPGNNKENKQ